MQLSYDLNAPVGLLGQPSEDFLKYVDTVIPQTAVKVAKFLVADTTVGKVRNAAMLPAAAGQAIGPRAMGITLFDATREGGADYPALRPIGVLRKGRIWVQVEEAVTRWTNPFVRFTANGALDVGSFRASADTARAEQVTKALYLTDAGAGELALLEIDL